MVPNLVLGILITLFAAFFLVEAEGLPARARMFPTALLWAIGIVGVLLMAEAVLHKLKPADTGDAGSGGSGLAGALIQQIAVPGAILLATYGLLTVVGFYFAVPVFLLVLYVYHIYRTGPENVVPATFARGIGFAVATTLGMYAVFAILLGLPAPSGLLF